MNLEYSTGFTVYPEHCNHELKKEATNIHGGEMLLQMDRCAAIAVRRVLYNNICDSYRTVGVTDVNFLKGAKLGDLITISAKIIEFGLKRIKVIVECNREDKTGENTLMANGIFWFVSFREDKPFPHGLSL